MKLHISFFLKSVQIIQFVDEAVHSSWVRGGPTESITAQPVITLLHLCGSSRRSLRFYQYFCRRKAAIVLRKVAKVLRFVCRTAENRGLNYINVKVVGLLLF